jgi:hypothetical protein
MCPCVTHLMAHEQAPREWEVCEKSTFLSLCLAKGAVGVFLAR